MRNPTKPAAPSPHELAANLHRHANRLSSEYAAAGEGGEAALLRRLLSATSMMAAAVKLQVDDYGMDPDAEAAAGRLAPVLALAKLFADMLDENLEAEADNE